MKRRHYTGLLFLLLLAALLAPRDAAAVVSTPKKVLLLTSYHQGDRWNDSVVQGVRETLGPLESISLSIENLDMRRYTDQKHRHLTTEYIRAKYQGRPQDLVLVSDDPALDFLLTVREDLFPTTPVVFCGVNNFTPKRIQGQSNITGVNEALSLEATLELALKLFPRTTRIMAVVSNTEASARTNLEHYRTVATRMKGRVQFGELLNMTDKEAPDILSNLPKDSLILRLTTFLKPEGGFLSIEDGSRIISASASVPVFTGWSFDLGNCALGGYVSSGLDQGRTAGYLAIRILEGEKADQIPVVMDSPNVPMFDYKVMERFGIKESDLPKGSVVLNLKVSVWEEYWAWLLGIALVCGLQTVLVFSLLYHRRLARKVTATLSESENNHKLILCKMQESLSVIDGDGNFLLANSTASKNLTGGDVENIIGQNIRQLIPEEQSCKLLATYRQVIDSGAPLVQEVLVTVPQGDRWFYNTLQPLEYGERKIKALLSISLDITERKRAEEALRESEGRLRESEHHFRALANSGLALIWTTGPDKLCNYLNESWLRYTGRTLEQELGHGWTESVHPEDLDRCLNIYVSHFDRREPFSMEYRLRKANGEYGWILVVGNPRHDSEGKFVGYIGFCYDITDRKRAEEEKKILNAKLQQAQKLEAIGTLAGGIAHDFNNILSAILGYTEIAKDDSEPGSKVIKDLDRVIEAGHRASGLVKQILAFSRQTTIETVPLNPKYIVKEAIKLLRPGIPSTIAITQHFASPIYCINADPTQIHQVVMNLCTNAFHAMETTGGTLDICLENKKLTTRDIQQYPNVTHGEFVVLSVSDTGPGIPLEIRDRIFDPYFTTKEVGKGTGMGLAIVHGIATTLNGFVSCESAPGSGAVFRVFLPAIQPDVLPPTLTVSVSDNATPTGKEHVLYVDDEEILAELGKTMLERLGYHVTLCTDSMAALSLFRENPSRYDVLVTDQTMPGMTGFELARTILQIRPNFPVILCTGFSNLVDEEDAKKAGIRGFIMKPFTQNGLGEMLAKVKKEFFA